MNKRVLKKQAVIRQQLQQAINKKAKNHYDLNKDKIEQAETSSKGQVTHAEEIMHDSLETFVKPEREG